MKLKISNQIEVEDVPPDLEREIRTRLTLKNPKYVAAQKAGRWMGNIDENLFFYRETKNGLTLPRGYARELFTLCSEYNVKPDFIDNRRLLPEVDISFLATLRGYQQGAVRDILSCDFGNLDSMVGSGKTTMSLAVIAARKQPTTVVVHSSQLLFQWEKMAVQFLNLPASEIGLYGAGHKTIGERLTIGIVNSVLKNVHEIKDKTGFLVVDEAHRAGSKGYCEMIGAFDCKYQLGVSGTPFRSDGLSKVIQWNLGPVVHKVPQKTLVKAGHILSPEVIWRNTRFTTELDPSEEYSKVVSEVVNDGERNRQIVSDVRKAMKEGDQTSLLLTERKCHCTELKNMLGPDAVMITGSTPMKVREKALDAVRDGTVRTLIATSSLIGEGTDVARLSNLFLCSPLKWKGRTIQLAGRILRPMKGKQARLFDYVDSSVVVLKAQAKARLETYREQGWC